MPGGRKGFYEELQVKKYLSEITPKIFNHINKVMDGNDEERKDRITEKIAPKILDKAIPTQITGEEGDAIRITVAIAPEVAQKNALTSNTSGDSEGHTQV